MDALLTAVVDHLDRGDSQRWPDRSGEYWSLCPFHNDGHATNFSVSERGYHCFSCGAEGGLRYLAEHLGVIAAHPQPLGCSLKDYAAAKHLPVQFLSGLGIKEIKERRGRDRIAVLHIPYRDEAGNLVSTRRRQALQKGPNGQDERFLWQKGAKVIPYGLWRLTEIRALGWTLLVEGESDCHTAWFHNIPCLGIPGASSWKSEWLHYLDGLSVYCWREPDAGGSAFIESLSRDLAARDSVRHITAPEGIKDLSDAHISGMDVSALVEDLRATAEPLAQAKVLALLDGDARGDVEKAHYELKEDGIYFLRPRPLFGRSGERLGTDWEAVQVTNFSAYIAHEIQRCDGEHLESVYTVQGQSDRPWLVEIGGEEFRDERKARGVIGSAAGARAIIYQARLFPVAIQEMSNGFDTETRYLSTGWQSVGGKLAFITPGSGASYCEVSEEMKRYGVAPGDFEQGANALVNGLLEAFSHKQTYFCVAHAFLAPLYRWMSGAKRYMLHLVGETGSLKTAYACALLSLYGQFSDEEPTEKWTSTIGKIERLGHEAKDVLFLVDDYKGRYVRSQDITTLVQNYSESRGRGRLNRDASIKQTYWIRGALMSTGEDIPEGEASVISRMLIIRLTRPQGANVKLRYAQERAEHLNAVMYEYTKWLAENTSADDERAMDQQIIRWRDDFMTRCPSDSTNPGRLATNLAQNKVAWSAMARFLLHRGVWSESEVSARLQEYDLYAGELLNDMARRVQQEKASTSFLAALRSLLDSGKAELLPRDTKAEEPSPGRELLGWKDGAFFYLLPEATFHAAEQWYRVIGQSIGFSRQAIEAQLWDDGLIERGSNSSKMTVTIRAADGDVVRVLKLRRDAIEEPAEGVTEELPF